MQKHRNLHTRLALADMNSMDSVFPLCKNNCKWLQHLLHAHRLHFSCVTIHSALREDEEYCSIKRFSPSPTAHPPTVVGRRIVLHFSWKTFTHTVLTRLMQHRSIREEVVLTRCPGLGPLPFSSWCVMHPHPLLVSDLLWVFDRDVAWYTTPPSSHLRRRTYSWWIPMTNLI